MSRTLSRRKFIAGSATLSALPLLGSSGAYADHHQVKLEETNPQAVALGYKHDASKAENAVAGQLCVNCQLYQGTPENEWAPCAIFSNKLVNGKGWCKAWVKKA